jgi:hypothetical protein
MGVLKKKIWDLERFTSMPEESHKRLTMERILRASQTVGIPIKRMSSTNGLCGMGREIPWGVRPEKE